jgi:hypothetical protein
MATRSTILVLLLTMIVALPNVSGAQEKPMSNAEVLVLVRNHKPESFIISQIRSHPGNFNTSPHEIIRLAKAGVTENEINAMAAASGQDMAPTSAAPARASSVPAADTLARKSRMPKVYLIQVGTPQELPLERTQLAETRTKPTSMTSLAADSTVTQALQAGVNTAAWDAAAHMNSAVGGSMAQQASGIFSGIMSHRKPTVTYVWGVPSPASATVLQTLSPTFSVDFSSVPTVNAADYEPAIVKLTPAQNTCRIVGATQGKEDARSSPAADWQVYSHFLEERVNAKTEKAASGKYKISPASELFPGEYAIVFRPISKEKKFSGGDVARAQGDGLMFDAAWTFQIADSAQ